MPQSWVSNPKMRTPEPSSTLPDNNMVCFCFLLTNVSVSSWVINHSKSRLGLAAHTFCFSKTLWPEKELICKKDFLYFSIVLTSLLKAVASFSLRNLNPPAVLRRQLMTCSSPSWGDPLARCRLPPAAALTAHHRRRRHPTGTDGQNPSCRRKKTQTLLRPFLASRQLRAPRASSAPPRGSLRPGVTCARTWPRPAGTRRQPPAPPAPNAAGHLEQNARTEPRSSVPLQPPAFRGACCVVFKLSPPSPTRWPSPPVTPRGGTHWLEGPEPRGAALPRGPRLPRRVSAFSSPGFTGALAGVTHMAPLTASARGSGEKRTEVASS